MRRRASPFALIDPPTVWPALAALDRALARGRSADAHAAYAALLRALLNDDRADLATALVAPLLEPSPLSRSALRGDPLRAGVRSAAEHDLDRLAALARRPWRRELADLGVEAPPLADLAAPDARLAPLAAALSRAADPGAGGLLDRLLDRIAAEGVGPLARHRVLRWNDGALEGVDRPAAPVRLVGLDDELGYLHADVEAFLDGLPAADALLYGPRGSGKSSAVRALPERYGDRGLRLIEVPAERLVDLPALLEALRDGVDRYLVFVDDLSFEEGDLRYRPLKSLLDGTVRARPDRVLLVATSNRRHLIRERFSDRPDPLNDDVHRWDTQHERLALSDRFGLTITFPSADQRRYLSVVRALVAHELPHEAQRDDLDGRAVLFADRQSGYSGRTARQFVDALSAGRA